MFSIVVVQTKVISYNSANKSSLLQIVHKKAIADLIQFCIFFLLFGALMGYFWGWGRVQKCFEVYSYG